MKPLWAVAALLACSVTVWGQTQGSCSQTLQTVMRPGMELSIDSMPAGLTIIGTDTAAIRVTCTAQDSNELRDVSLRLTASGGQEQLKVEGGSTHRNGVQVRIEVPRKTSLRVEMGAGQVSVEDVEGNQQIQLYAGQIEITSHRWWDYREVNASVDIGQVSAPAYGTDRGGFFGSFEKTTPGGEYTLHAHVTTGQIELLGTAPGKTAD